MGELTFLKKNANMLIIQYIDPLDKNINRLDYKILKVFLHNINDDFEDIEQFKEDWHNIVSKIRDGKAHEFI